MTRFRIHSPVLAGFLIATGALALLIAVLDPPPSRGLGLPGRLVFWGAHVGIGLLCAVLAARAFGSVRALTRWPAFARLVLFGLAGGALFAPVALALEAVLPAEAVVDDDPDLFSRWEAAGGLAALAAEYLQLLPSYLSAWLVLNLSPMTAWMRPAGVLAPAPDAAAAAPAAAEDATDPANAANAAAAVAREDPASSAEVERFLARLPPALGRELLLLTADLHYLHVTTALGRTMLLGSIGEAERALADRGLRVHRSHWVALRHVRRVARSADGWYCELCDGTRLPISRRRLTAVRARLGVDFVRDDASDSSGIAPL